MRMSNFIGLLVVLLMMGCGEKKPEWPKVRIAGASNIHATIDSLARAFEYQYGISCEISTGATGVLTAQLRQGAPFDFFVAAGTKYIEYLKANGELQSSKEIARCGITLLYSKHIGSDLTLEEIILSDSVRQIGIPNPDFAPFGEMASNYLQQKDLWNQVKSKLVFGESVAQVHQHLSSNAVDAAIVAGNRSAFKHVQYYQRPLQDAGFVPTILGKVGKTNSDASMKFEEFVVSEEARGVLEYFGYQVKS